MSDYKTEQKAKRNATPKGEDKNLVDGSKIVTLQNRMRRLLGLEFQCACCRELTKITVQKPGRLRPVRATQTCRVCESVSDLTIEKMKDGAIRVKTTECRPTEEGMKHYYMYHPEKDPDYVQPNGTNDNQSVEAPKETDDSTETPQ